MAMKPITLRLSPSMHGYLKRSADHAGTTLSDFIREAAFGRAVFEATMRQDPTIFDQESCRREIERLFDELNAG